MSTTFNRQRIVRDVIVIGASAGGIEATVELLSRLPSDLPAFLGVVIHRGARAPRDWSATLGRKARLSVVEPADGAALRRGVVNIAPSDCHMRFECGMVRLDRHAKEHHTRPAVDPLFESAALEYGPRVVGVVLTGGGTDGTKGLLAISAAGGLSLVQRPSEAVQPRMPENAIAHDHVNAALSVAEIGAALARLTLGWTVTSESGLESTPLPASAP